jgi:uncharacterized protein (TIGR03435 family)
MALGTVQWLIECAYGIPAARGGQEIIGGLKWLNEDVFAISATSPSDHVPKSQAEGLVMLRTLLADRFKLVLHRERRDVPMWALVVTRRDRRLGPELHPTAADCAAWIAGGRPIFTVLQEQLGLKLESIRGAVDLLVIDHAERPTAN